MILSIIVSNAVSSVGYISVIGKPGGVFGNCSFFRQNAPKGHHANRWDNLYIK
jgi:hypothetical protein